MATIFYSMAGEGRGHATRVRTLTESLRPRHRLVLLAPGDAYAMLSEAYRDQDVEVLEIPGLRFAYGSDERVARLGTARLTAGYLRRLPALIQSVGRRLVEESADLLITDYDPGGPRAAERFGVPYVALDHQSFFNVGDLRFLPGGLRRRAAGIARLNRLMYRRQIHTISSSFFEPELLPGVRETTLVGPLLRPAVRAARPELGLHVTAYCRRRTPPAVLEALAQCGREVRVYGLGERPDDGRLRFRPISEQGFIDDLASGLAVVASAGNQLLGESLALGKRVFALPEGGQHEQLINCLFLERMQGGRYADPGRVEGAELRAFLDAAAAGDLPPVPRVRPGNGAAIERLESILDAVQVPQLSAAPA